MSFNISHSNTLPVLKTSKFLEKFKNKISTVGKEGVANALSNVSNTVNLSSNRPLTKKNLSAWKDVYEECKFLIYKIIQLIEISNIQMK